MKKGKSMYKIILLLLIFCVCSAVCYIVSYLSFSKYNQYPRQEMEKILEDTYHQKFTFLKQEYFLSEYCHVWEMYFIDEDGKEFQEYFYMGNSDIKVASYKEYGQFWDTFAQLYLEERYNQEMKLDTFRNNADVKERRIQYHYIFSVNTEQEIGMISDWLAQLYETIFSFTKDDQGLNGFILNCKVTIRNQDLCIFSAPEIYKIFKKDGTKSIKKYIEGTLKEKLSISRDTSYFTLPE